MKQIIDIAAGYGREFRTRATVSELRNKLIDGNEYLLDMKDVTFISRSAADELYSLIHEKNVSVVHVDAFVQQMLDAVAIGRFTPRRHDQTDVTFVSCPDKASLTACLLSWSQSANL